MDYFFFSFPLSQFPKMSKPSLPYCQDVVPVLSRFMGVDADARNLAGLIVRFTGYVITDCKYAKFRAQVMELVHQHMSRGRGGVDVIQARLNHSFQYNETHALWLMTDLAAWGFACRPWFIEDGDTSCFMSVSWATAETAPFPICLCLPSRARLILGMPRGTPFHR